MRYFTINGEKKREVKTLEIINEVKRLGRNQSEIFMPNGEVKHVKEFGNKIFVYDEKGGETFFILSNLESFLSNNTLIECNRINLALSKIQSLSVVNVFAILNHIKIGRIKGNGLKSSPYYFEFFQ